MKILQIAPHLLPVPPTQGGAVEDGIYRVAKILSNDHDVTVISRPSKTVPKDKIQYLYIPFSFYEKPLLAYFYKYRNHLSARFRRLLKYPYAFKLNKILPHNQDIIHIRNLAVAIPFLHKISDSTRVILHLHNIILKQTGIKNMIYRQFINNYDLILCVSNFVRESTLAKYPFLSDKCRVLYNGVDREIFQPLGSIEDNITRQSYNLGQNKVILYSGRIIFQKGVLNLIRAFNIVKNEHQNVKLIIAGSREFKFSKDDLYIKQVKSEANCDVIFTGYIEHSELRKLYSIADIFVYPSIWQEPFGKAILEAMAAKTAIIASNRGGIPELIENNKDGILIDPTSIDDIAWQVCSLLSDESKLNALKNAAWQKSEAFSWEKITDQLVSVYSELLRT